MLIVHNANCKEHLSVVVQCNKDTEYEEDGIAAVTKGTMWRPTLSDYRCFWWLVFLLLLIGVLLLGSACSPIRQCVFLWSNKVTLNIPANTWTDVPIAPPDAVTATQPNFGVGATTLLQPKYSRWQLLSDGIRLQSPASSGYSLYDVTYHLD